MKYNCPFCKSMMSYTVEKQYCHFTGVPTIDYLIHKCKKSKCKIETLPKYKIWEYREHVQGVSIILDNNLKTYKIVSRYDLNVTSMSKVGTEMSFNYTTNVVLKKIMEINKAIKIDLGDPINSGLQVIDRLMKLRAFS